MNNYEKKLNVLQAKCIGTSENKEFENKLQSVINKIIDKKNIIDKELFNQRT